MEDSPERGISSVNAHSPAVQDSPFFNYLNTLSPIKTVKSVHVAQTFSELHFPPPPAVFTSPRVAIQKETNFPKRSHQNDMGEKASKTYHSAYTGNDKGNSFNGDASHCDSTTPFASATKEAFGSSQTLSTKKFDDKNINKLLSCCGSYHLSDPMEEKNNGKAYTCPINAKYLGFTEQSNSQGAVASCHGVMEEMSIDSEPKDSVELTALLHKATGIGTSQGLAKGSLRMVDLLEQSVSHQNVTTEVVCASSAVDSDNANRQKLSSNNKSLEPNSNHDAHLVACTQDSVTILLANSSVCESNTGQKAPNTECSCVMLQQSLKDITSQCEMTGESNQVDTTPQPLHDSFQGPTGCDDLHRKCDNEQTKPTEHQASFACKSSSHLARGIRRRCLDFEATQAQNKVMNNSLKVLNSSKASASAMTSLNMTSLLPLSHEYKEASEGKQLVPRDKDGDVCESSSSLTLMPFSSCSSKPVNIAAGGMPSGIGLHLNSLATTMSITSGINSPTSAKGPMNKQGPPTLTSTNENLPNPGASTQTHVTSGGNPGSTSTVASGMASSVPETPKIDQQEAHSSGKQGGVTKTISCFRGLTVGIEPMQCGMPLKSEEMNPLGKRPTPHDIPRQPDLSANDEPNQGSRGSPKKKRRKSTANSDKEGCKRCNCKKSKCLKLYCECFAAGIYCVEPCTCHECFNKPEYEDMVLGTRQQIESRNPFAFAPKIVCNLNSSSNADNCGATSVSARHKRGCNCKKSMCLKKYCECYQAGVGCSDGCRCGSCKNVFGRKEGGSDDAEDKVHDEAPEKDSSEEKVELHDSGNDTLLSEQHANDLSPITPSLQPFRQAIAMTRSEFSAKKQNVQISVTSQSRSEHPKSPGSCLRPAKGMHGNVTNDTYPHFGPRTSVPLIFSPEAQKSREFSPRWDSFGDICSITPQLHRSLRTSSASNPDSTDAFPINAQSTEIPSLKSQSSTSANNNNESLPLVPRVSATSTPFCLPGKNVWQNSLSAYGSPLAPSLNNTGSNGGTKGVAVAKADFDMHSNDAASLAEDDTPEFLTNTCSPTKGLKANSPNQKRVSPPHHCHEKEINRSLLLSPGLKSGKKFILQSVPSFPVLKTCEDDDKD